MFFITILSLLLVLHSNPAQHVIIAVSQKPNTVFCKPKKCLFSILKNIYRASTKWSVREHIRGRWSVDEDGLGSEVPGACEVSRRAGYQGLYCQCPPQGRLDQLSFCCYISHQLVLSCLCALVCISTFQHNMVQLL